MLPAPEVLRFDTLPDGAVDRAAIRMQSLIAAGADLRPTTHQLVVFALALLAEAVGEIRFDPAGLLPKGKTPADHRFLVSANRCVGHWHTALPPVWVHRNGDGTVTIKATVYHPKGGNWPWCWHEQCEHCDRVYKRR